MPRMASSAVMYANEHKKCIEFNKRFPVGTSMLLEGYSGNYHEVKIIQPAAVVLMHACAYASGYGCYSIDRFKPITNG